MNVDCSTNMIFSSHCIIFSPRAKRLGGQLCHAHKVIRRSYPPRRQLRSLGSPITRFPKSSHRLHPTEDLFDSLSYPLTDAIALMTSRSCINSRTAFFARHMRDNLSPAQKPDKVLGVVTLVGAQAFYLHAFAPLTFDHVLGCFPLSAAGGLTDQQIDQQAVAVFHQGMGPVTKLCFFSRPLAHQQTVGIGLRLMGLIGALLAMKIHPAVAQISLIFISTIFSLGRKLFRLAHASIRVPFTV